MYDEITIDDFESELCFEYAKENPLITEFEEMVFPCYSRNSYDKVRVDMSLEDLYGFLNKKQKNINNLLDQNERLKKKEYRKYNISDETFKTVSYEETSYKKLPAYKLILKMPYKSLSSLERYSDAFRDNELLEDILDDRHRKAIYCTDEVEKELEEYRFHPEHSFFGEYDYNSLQIVFDVKTKFNAVEKSVIVTLIHSQPLTQETISRFMD